MFVSDRVWSVWSHLVPHPAKLAVLSKRNQLLLYCDPK